MKLGCLFSYIIWPKQFPTILRTTHIQILISRFGSSGCKEIGEGMYDRPWFGTWRQVLDLNPLTIHNRKQEKVVVIIIIIINKVN